jgi:hypothetical protein
LQQSIGSLRCSHQSTNNPAFLDTKKRFETFDLKMLPCPFKFDEFYLVRMTVFRTHIVVSLVSRNFPVDSSCKLICGSVIDDKQPEETEFDIHLTNIRSLVSEYDGFYIMMRASEEAVYFSSPIVSLKQEVMAKIESNALKYLGLRIPLEGLTRDYCLNLKMNASSDGGEYRFYDCLRMTPFNDYVRLTLAVNDKSIFQIANGSTTSKLSIDRVIRIGVNRKRLRQVELYYSSGEVVRYAMTIESESSFISQVHGVIQNASSGRATAFQNSLIFLGHMKVESSLILGIEQVDDFREQFERENFDTFIKEQREENFLNYHFVNGFSGFALNSFIATFEPLMNKSLSLVPALAFRKDFEDSLVSFLLSNLSSEVVVPRHKPSTGHQEEDWFAKLPPEERTRPANARRLVYQSRKIFRDQLKEILNEECFGVKIESELLVDRMWSFLANMMQSGVILREVSMALNSSNKADAEPFLRLFHLAIQILLQGELTRERPGRFPQRGQVHQPVHRLLPPKLE